MTSVVQHTNKFKTHLKSTTPTSMRFLHRKALTLATDITHLMMKGPFLVEVRHNITTKRDMMRMLTSSTKMTLRL